MATDKIFATEAARILNVTKAAVIKMEARGVLHADRIGRVRVFSRREVLALAKKRAAQARAKAETLERIYGGARS